MDCVLPKQGLTLLILTGASTVAIFMTVFSNDITKVICNFSTPTNENSNSNNFDASVTRLGYFKKSCLTIFLTKLVEISLDVLDSFEIYHFLNKTVFVAFWPFWGKFWLLLFVSSSHTVQQPDWQQHQQQ